jgi:hypothetical protein
MSSGWAEGAARICSSPMQLVQKMPWAVGFSPYTGACPNVQNASLCVCVYVYVRVVACVCSHERAKAHQRATPRHATAFARARSQCTQTHLRAWSSLSTASRMSLDEVEASQCAASRSSHSMVGTCVRAPYVHTSYR